MKLVVYVFRLFVLSEMAERKCCVKGCGRNKRKNKEASFFQFPKVRQEERELTESRLLCWQKRVNIPDAEFNEKLVVCDIHFVLGNIIYFFVK